MDNSKRLKILLSCYSCGPGRGSEPGVGWNAALALAEFHDVHVLTSSEFQRQIEARIADGFLPAGLSFHFFEIPLGEWVWRHPSGMAIRLHYVLWQRLARSFVRGLHRQFNFDTAQHVTFVRYCAESCVEALGIPYILGPVGGAETTPKCLSGTHSFGGGLIEHLRRAGRWLGEHSPRVLRTLRKAGYVLAVTPQTYERCVALGANPERTQVYPAIGISEQEFGILAKNPSVASSVCFFGSGRLINWKRYDLAIRAFAKAAVPGARLLFIGGGPEENRLMTLASDLGIAGQVEFTGFLPREQALAQLARGHVLIHPSVHDSGGCVCLESMAAGRPVICLDWAGPGVLVSTEAGIKVPVGDDNEIVDGIAAAMRRLADAETREVMGYAGKRLVKNKYLWSSKAAFYSELHLNAVGMYENGSNNTE